MIVGMDGRKKPIDDKRGRRALFRRQQRQMVIAALWPARALNMPTTAKPVVMERLTCHLRVDLQLAWP